MKRKLIISSAVILLLGILITIALSSYRDVAWALVYQSEKIGSKEFSALLACKKDIKSTVTIKSKDGIIEFSLPKGAAEFYSSTYPKHEKKRQYLVSKQSWSEFEKMISEEGYKLDQMGSEYNYFNARGQRIVINHHMFTRNFRRIEISLEAYGK